MQLSALTRSSVLQAIEKCDKDGRPKFLKDHGFKPAREYFLLFEGRAYDSKAIVGAAYGLMTGERCTAEDFSGGLTLTRRLEQLGFEVTGKMAWTFEEQILACDLLDRNNWQTIPESDPRTETLSELLRGQWVYAPSIPEYRSTDSVHHKFEDLRTAHPDYTGTRTRGGKLSVQVAVAFANDRDKMRSVAEMLRQNGQLALVLDHDDERAEVIEAGITSADDFATAIEGKARHRMSRVYERDPQLRKRKIQQSRRERSSIACEVCEFDFEVTYPGLGDNFIHVHHVMPLHVSGPVETTLDDLVLLCANCHQMIHRPKEWLTPDELRAKVVRSPRNLG
ncbi:HNH endonuclease [Nocardia sp. NRRL WC-3656]|uniref:HNH endonuclease n=1 Tax=Nocardia sp. NRRL WC-3656 TaxID=1463824 RepID=UPI0007C86263|nr:HNH endonuclease [Nocardia sp. NRRL WC-3656]